MANHLNNQLTCNLSGELMLDILPRLPEESLLRFRSVNKSWCSFVDNSLVVGERSDLWFNCSSYNSFVVLDRFGADEIELQIGGTNCDPEKLAVVGSSKGLVCVTPLGPRFSRQFTVFKIGEFSHDSQWRPLSEAENIVPGFVSLGFGFDDQGGGFKIVRIQRFLAGVPGTRYLHISDVYSTNIKSWKRIKGSQDLNLQDHLGNTLESSVYWMAFDVKLSTTITGFSLSTETFHSIHIPKTRETHSSLVGGLLSERQQSVGFLFYNPKSCVYQVWTVSADQITKNAKSSVLVQGCWKTKMMYYKTGKPTVSSVRTEKWDLAFSCGSRRLTVLNLKWRNKFVNLPTDQFSQNAGDEYICCYREIVPAKDLKWTNRRIACGCLVLFLLASLMWFCWNIKVKLKTWIFQV